MTVLYLVDTSAAARFKKPAVARNLVAFAAEGFLATCLPLDLEAAYSASSAKQVEKVLMSRYRDMIQLEIDPRVEYTAREICESLAAAGKHRAAGATDVTIAACALVYDATVLHYDGDYQHIADVTELKHQWIVPRGIVS